MKKPNLDSFKKEDLEKIVLECVDKADLAKRLGFTYTNGIVYKKIINLLLKFEISFSHFDKTAKVKNRRIYPIIKKSCPVCLKEFETSKNSKKEKSTCSCTCANKMFSYQKHSALQRLKVSRALLRYRNSMLTTELINNEIKFKHTCLICRNIFYSFKNKTLFCSKICLKKRPVSDETRKKLSVSVRKRISEGTHKGWSSRLKLLPSFPEKIILDILNELNLSLEREFKFNKWFIDFADINNKIALEIDGRQHEFPERKASDEKKDAYLLSQGWQVNRIKWKKLTKEFREEVKNKIIEIFRR